MAEVPDADVRDSAGTDSLERSHERELLRRYAKDRSPEARDELIRRFVPLARSLAIRYRGSGEPLDDLVGVANLGLVKAIDRFDPDRGRPFTGFAVPTILGELRRHFRDHVWNLRLPRGLQERSMKIGGAVDELIEDLGRSPTPAEIAARIGIATEDVLEGLAARAARNTLSFDAPADAERYPVSATTGATEPGYDRVEADLASGSARLSERERYVLRKRFGDDLTQSEIGVTLGISQMQVSRISRRALWKLLAAVRGEECEGQGAPRVRARSTESAAARPDRGGRVRSR